MLLVSTSIELWEDIKSFSFDEVVINNGLHLQHIGEFSREFTAMAMVITLNSALKEVRDNYIKHLNNCSSLSIK